MHDLSGTRAHERHVHGRYPTRKKAAMRSTQVAIDPRGVTHAVKFEPIPHPGELRTECGAPARWKRLTLWWSPPVPVDCMSCLVVEAKK